MTRILLTGRTGQVGSELERVLARHGDVIATDRRHLDLADPDSIRAAVRRIRPDIIANAAGFTAVDDVERAPDLAMRVNGVAPGVLGEEAKRLGALLVHYSTAYVFDGKSDRPYTEDDAPHPVNVYGKSKLAGEQALAATGCDHLILRASWIYSLRGTNFLLAFLERVAREPVVPVVSDQVGNPTWARSIAEATTVLLGHRGVREAPGIYHLSAAGAVSRFEFAQRILDLARERMPATADWPTLKSVATSDYPLPAARPLNCSTSKEKFRRAFGIEMGDWQQQLSRCMRDPTGRGRFLDVLGRRRAEELRR